VRPIGADSQAPNEQVSSLKLKQIGKIMQVQFPDDTKVLGLLEDRGGIDRAIYLKVEFAAKELKEFINKSPFAASNLSTRDRSVSDLKEVSWWKPESVKTFQSGQERLPDAKVLNVLIDLGKGDKTIVFLMWFST
jgi:hypothetical protein